MIIMRLLRNLLLSLLAFILSTILPSIMLHFLLKNTPKNFEDLIAWLLFFGCSIPIGVFCLMAFIVALMFIWDE